MDSQCITVNTANSNRSRDSCDLINPEHLCVNFRVIFWALHNLPNNTTDIGRHTKEKPSLLLIPAWAPLIAYLNRREMAPLSRQEKRKTKVRSISQFYTAVCVDGFVWVHKYTPGERVLCFRGFQNRATTLSILSRRPHPPITFAGFPPAFHLKTVFQFQSLQREPPLSTYLLCGKMNTSYQLW